MFVQINDRAFNTDLVTQVWWEEGKKSVTLYLITIGPFSIPTMTFTSREYDAFADWWDNKADVYIISVQENADLRGDTHHNDVDPHGDTRHTETSQ